ncbi:MAG: AAA family ATPase, partial [Chitinophagales bacterium]
MEIKKLQIQNYKSLVNFELVEPNPFTVFIGPNASGKSNFFEALEFVNYYANGIQNAESLFGGEKDILPFNFKNSSFYFDIKLS